MPIYSAPVRETRFVLHDVLVHGGGPDRDRERFAPGYLASVERHTASGNGFIMLGADASFAPGSYRQKDEYVMATASQQASTSGT